MCPSSRDDDRIGNISMTASEQNYVRSVSEVDAESWRTLFRAYRDFYGLEESHEVESRVWSWLLDPEHECQGLVAEADGRIVGIAHYRIFSRPSTGTTGIWLDDLYTAANERNTGVGRALIDRVTELCALENRSLVRGITAENNRQAQALYETLATRTDWITYDATPVPPSQ
jgi:GNAT superfamily N-acetyltransferase